MSWHPDHPTLQRYVTGDLSAASVMSIEAHVTGCAECRSTVAVDVDPVRLDHIWSEVVDTLDEPRPLLLERVARRCGIAPHTARLIATTPTLRVSWIAAIAACLAFATAAANVTGGSDVPFLFIAPIVPVAGVALSFGRPFDPLWEITGATPTGVVRLVLWRSAAVLAVSIAVAVTLSPLLPGSMLHSIAWLLPALAMVSATLALSTTRLTVAGAATAVVGCWAVGVTAAGWAAADADAAFRLGGQLAALAVTTVATAVLARSHDLLERRPLTAGG